MKEEFVTFQKFKDPEIADDIADKLKAAHVQLLVENDDKFFDSTFAYNPLNKETRIKIRSKDFNKANDILNTYYKQQVQNVPADYYLFEFTNKELFEILSHPDEWGNFDYALAEEILKQRGEHIESAELEWLKNKRVRELSKPENRQIELVIIGYMAALLSGVFGVLIGLMLTASKKTLPDGSVMHMYRDSDRKHGEIILAISVVVLIGCLFVLLKNQILR